MEFGSAREESHSDSRILRAETEIALWWCVRIEDIALNSSTLQGECEPPAGSVQPGPVFGLLAGTVHFRIAAQRKANQ